MVKIGNRVTEVDKLLLICPKAYWYQIWVEVKRSLLQLREIVLKGW